MKVFRFMSKTEFEDYQRGRDLLNTTDHAKEESARTNSIGFCFLDLEEYEPEQAFHFLCGLVSDERCAVFEVDEKYLHKSHGFYAKHDKETNDTPLFLDLFRRMLAPELYGFTATEYCTMNYSNKHFKLLRWTTPDWDTEDWRWKDEQI